MPCCGNVKCPYCGALVKKKKLPEHEAVCPANPVNQEKNEMSEDRYHCTKCGRTHKTDSKIGKDHLEFKEEPSLPTEEAVSVDESAPEEQPIEEAEGGIGGLKFGSAADNSPPTPPKREIPILQKEDRTFEKLNAGEDTAEFCKYLYWARDSCVDCQGHRCAAASDKKLSPGLVDEICRTTAYLECFYYNQALETGVPQICPYQGPPPAEKAASCSGVWCYADNRNVRVTKTCKKFWVNCDTFARKKWAGVPFYRNLPKEPEPKEETTTSNSIGSTAMDPEPLEEIEDREVKEEEPT